MKPLYQTVIGLLAAAVTVLAFYLVARNRYKCPYCGRRVKWSDESCPHCGGDMKAQHRVGPPPSRVVEPIFSSRSRPETGGGRGRRSRRGRH